MGRGYFFLTSPSFSFFDSPIASCHTFISKAYLATSVCIAWGGGDESINACELGLGCGEVNKTSGYII